MSVNPYFLQLGIIGLLLLLVTLGSSLIARLPLSYALIYLLVGIVLGPYGVNLVQVNPKAEFLEHLSEFIVIVSLFSCGLKINRPLKLWAWNATIRLILVLMPLSIFAVALLGHWFLGLNWGLAILLGAILAPTDPVLASEVQLNHAEDQDELRFALTSEGGLNDAFAFPFVYFGLYWLKNPDWQSWVQQWLVVDVVWSTIAGIGMGVLVASAIAYLDRWMQRFYPVDELLEDFIALSTILLTYTLTEAVNGYGFVAVFVAGIVMRRSYRNFEKRCSMQLFIERIEKLLEIGTIILLASLLRFNPTLKFMDETLLIGGFLIFIIRPTASWLCMVGTVSIEHLRHTLHPATRWLVGWFGIRGVGSLYYLSYALGQGLQGPLAEELTWITYLTIVFSVIIHGTSATPLMNWYERRIKPETAA